jgi:hypothetical protein
MVGEAESNLLEAGGRVEDPRVRAGPHPYRGPPLPDHRLRHSAPDSGPVIGLGFDCLLSAGD